MAREGNGGQRNMLMGGQQFAQSSGGSPYDEDSYMPLSSQGSPVNSILNSRLQGRVSPAQLQFMTQQAGPRRAMPPDVYGGSPGGPGGGDADMMAVYGPEDQVAFDADGKPIPLADPRHPRNRQNDRPVPGYPQQRR